MKSESVDDDVRLVASLGCSLTFVKGSEREVPEGLLSVFELRKGVVRLDRLSELHSAAIIKALDVVNSDVTDDGLAALSDFTSLETVRISGAGVTGRGLRWLTRAEDLQIAKFEDCPNLGDEIADTLSHCKKLQKAYFVGNCPLTDDATKAIGNWPSIRSLMLTGTKITNQGVSNLLSLKTLRSISLPNTVTSEGKDLIRKHLPDAHFPLYM